MKTTETTALKHMSRQWLDFYQKNGWSLQAVRGTVRAIKDRTTRYHYRDYFIEAIVVPNGQVFTTCHEWFRTLTDAKRRIDVEHGD